MCCAARMSRIVCFSIPYPIRSPSYYRQPIASMGDRYSGRRFACHPPLLPRIAANSAAALLVEDQHHHEIGLPHETETIIPTLNTSEPARVIDLAARPEMGRTDQSETAKAIDGTQTAETIAEMTEETIAEERI